MFELSSGLSFYEEHFTVRNNFFQLHYTLELVDKYTKSPGSI